MAGQVPQGVVTERSASFFGLYSEVPDCSSRGRDVAFEKVPDAPVPSREREHSGGQRVYHRPGCGHPTQILQ